MIRKRWNYINKTDKLGRRKYLMPCYGSRDIYNYYRKDIKKRIPSMYNINYTQHRDILEAYNKKIIEYILKGYDVKLPAVGKLVIRKKYIPLETTIGFFEKSSRSIRPESFLREGKWKPFIKYRRVAIKNVKNLIHYSFKPGGNFQVKLDKLFATKDGHKKYFEL